MTKRWWMAFGLAASFVLWGTLLLVLVPFAYGSEFGSSTTSTTTITTSRTITQITNATGTFTYNATKTGVETFTIVQKVSTPDYTIPILTFLVLAIAGVAVQIAEIAHKRMKK